MSSVYFLPLLLICTVVIYSRYVSCECQCTDGQYCNLIKDITRKEIFIFSLENDAIQWSHYDWTKVTTVVMVGYVNQSLMCLAHKHGARAILIANYPTISLRNSTLRTQWVKNNLKTVRENFLDGINIDFEDAIPQNDVHLMNAYTDLVNETFATFKQSSQYYQITVDVPWSPVGIDERYYDYLRLSWVSDFLFVMMYDEQSQIRGDCVAGPNSGLDLALTGVSKYLTMGVDRSKLVLGVPWYGYIYQCIDITQDKKCAIKPVPFRGVNCSDAAGKEINYSYIVTSLLPKSSTGRMWDKKAQSPYFNYDMHGVNFQIWYDDPESLRGKYNLSTHFDLRGVGMWNADAVDFKTDPNGTKQMWDALPNYN